MRATRVPISRDLAHGLSVRTSLLVMRVPLPKVWYDADEQLSERLADESDE